MSFASRLFTLVHSVSSKLNGLMTFIAGWLVLVITVISCYGVFTRYVLEDPDTWSFSMSAYLLCFVIFFAMSSALQQGVHVRVDILKELFPGRIAKTARVVSDLACLVFLWVFFNQTWKVFYDSFSRGRIDETTLAWPIAAIQWAMPLGVALTLLTQAVMLIGRFIGRDEEAQAW